MTRHLPIALVALLPWSLLGAVSSDPPPVAQPWPMHHVCRDFLIANSLNAADVDDGAFDDYSVIDERRGLMTIIFHPPKGGDVRKEWPRMILGETGNPECACCSAAECGGSVRVERW